MSRNTRLNLCVIVILGSALYSFLLYKTPDFARAVALGYIAILLTVLVASNLWKKE